MGMINEKEYAKVIAVNLRNIMYERHLTQADLARDLNINKATISSWMNATRTPKMANIDLLCDYFVWLSGEVLLHGDLCDPT